MRNLILFMTATLVAMVAGYGAGSTATEPPAPVTAEQRLAIAEDAYTDAGGGSPVWGHRACNALDIDGVTLAQVEDWLVSQYDLEGWQADIVVTLAPEHLCRDHTNV